MRNMALRLKKKRRLMKNYRNEKENRTMVVFKESIEKRSKLVEEGHWTAFSYIPYRTYYQNLDTIQLRIIKMKSLIVSAI